ncbi:MAG: alpha/beta fold hydrolase [Flavisolibacter sp.]
MAPALSKTIGKPLLYLHGGPGIATLENVPKYLGSKTWLKIRQDRPLVFFDYRGTGFSEPTLCPDIMDSLAKADEKKLSPEEKQSYKIELYKQCRIWHMSQGIDIATFNTFQLAEDAENIRKALDIDNWNVYGVSHGTTVALNLLRNHGENIHSVILDSPFPPNAPWLDFVRPFAASFKVLEEKIAEDPVAFSHFPSVRSDFVKAVARLNTEPYRIKINNSGGEYPFTGNDFAWSIWTALLKPPAIPLVPLALKEVANGNDTILFKWVSSFNDPNSFGKFSELQSKAILCYEGKPKTESDTKASLYNQYPDFASFNIDFEGDLCEAWQPKGAGREAFKPVVSKVPVLILSGEYDPVCPPVFGEITARTLSRSTFINVPAASHAVIHQDDCTRNIAFTFLADPTKPISIECINKRPINFVTDSLSKALSEFSKKN